LDDDFVLVPPGSTGPVQAVTILLRGTEAQAQAAAGVGGIGRPGSVAVTSDATSTALISRGSSEQKTAAALVLVLATVVLLLVALVAAAGFVVVAQRRLRQLGMMAAVGASDRHLRLVVVANGLVVGVIAAVTGTVVGVLAWLAVAPALEGAAGHRIGRFDVPWWVLGAGMVLAVLTAAAAAWWPARAMARVPIVQALSARPPRPRVGGRFALVAVALIAVGFICLSAGIDVKHDKATPALLIPGTIAIALGVLFASPLAIRALAATARRWPVAMRLALRDLGRHQARSGAALAAISLGVGIAVATVVIATVAQKGASEGNLSDRQVLVHLGSTSDPVVPERTPAAIATMRVEIDRLAASIPGARVLELDVAVDPTGKALVNGFNDNQPASGETVRPAVELVRQVSAHSWRGVARLYVASPELLRYLGIDGTKVRADTEVLTSHVGNFAFAGLFKGEGPPAVEKTELIEAPAYTSSPNSLITESAMRHYGWSATPSGWLLESSRKLSDADLTKARETAVANGLSVEARRGQGGLVTTRTGATAAGVLLALGILAMTVGLIRGEAAADLRTLTATGATSSLRRALTATTAAALALLGAVLGIAGAYVALIAGYLDKLGQLSNVPIRQLTVTAVGLPLAAAVAGWLLAGREPAAVARQPLLE
jgi:putative ABC transport system permease protein